MFYKPNDHYARKAREENFKARSVYKLEEIDKKYQVVPRQGKVLDLGACPGSWSQYIHKKGKGKLKITAFDLQPIEVSFSELYFYQLDVTTSEAGLIIDEHGLYDLILSDMAPATTGVRFRDQMLSLELVEMVWEINQRSLKKGGSLVFKIFESEEAAQYIKKLKRSFKQTSLFKPKSTRSCSYEIFFIGKGFVG